MRMYIFALALLFAVGGMVCGTAQAQCTIDTGYGAYDSESLDSTGTHILTSVLVDGSASMSGSCGDLTYVTHQGQVISYLNGVGAWSYGDYTCPFCNVSAQVDQDSGPLSDGQVIGLSYNASVNCSAAGLIFTVSINTSIEIAATLTQTTGGTSGHWSVTPYCTPATTPPDYAPNFSPQSASSPYWLQKAICKNNSGMPNGVFCFPTTTTAKPAPQDRYACTKNLQ